MFTHTVRKGQRLGMVVDLTTGTAWSLGGLNVAEATSAKAWKFVDGRLTAVPTRQQVKRPAPGGAGLVVDYVNRAAIETYPKRFISDAGAVANEAPRRVQRFLRGV